MNMTDPSGLLQWRLSSGSKIPGGCGSCSGGLIIPDGYFRRVGPSGPAQTGANGSTIVTSAFRWVPSGTFNLGMIGRGESFAPPDNPLERMFEDLMKALKNESGRFVCSALSHIGDGDRLRLGVDAAGGNGGAGRAGAGLSVDNRGQIWMDLYAGLGFGRGASGAGGLSYVINAPSVSEMSLTMSGDLGSGPVGTSLQTGWGTRSGVSTSGSVNLGFPLIPIPGSGRYGADAMITVTGQVAEPVTDPLC